VDERLSPGVERKSIDERELDKTTKYQLKIRGLGEKNSRVNREEKEGDDLRIHRGAMQGAPDWDGCKRKHRDLQFHSYEIFERVELGNVI